MSLGCVHHRIYFANFSIIAKLLIILHCPHATRINHDKSEIEIWFIFFDLYLSPPRHWSN